MMANRYCSTSTGQCSMANAGWCTDPMVLAKAHCSASSPPTIRKCMPTKFTCMANAAARAKPFGTSKNKWVLYRPNCTCILKPRLPLLIPSPVACLTPLDCSENYRQHKKHWCSNGWRCLALAIVPTNGCAAFRPVSNGCSYWPEP